MKSIAEWLKQRELSIEELVEHSGLDKKVVLAMVEGRYTSSPKQRERLAAALDTSTDQISWNYSIEVDHMYGHGPQFGRSP